jgi:hypothetical protein
VLFFQTRVDRRAMLWGGCMCFFFPFVVCGHASLAPCAAFSWGAVPLGQKNTRRSIQATIGGGAGSKFVVVADSLVCGSCHRCPCTARRLVFPCFALDSPCALAPRCAKKVIKKRRVKRAAC